MAEETQSPPNPERPASPSKPWYDPILWFFSSVSVAVIILILLAAISIIGTVLQQENIGDVADNLKLFEAFVGKFSSGDHDQIHATAERLFELSGRLGFYTLYHTWYFYTLLALLAASLTVCSLRRLPRTYEVMARPRVALEEATLRASPNRRSYTVRLPVAAAADGVAGALRKAGYRLRAEERDGVRYLFGQKGTYSRLGVYVTHLSILIVLAGGIMGNLYGFKGYLQVTEGEAEDRFVLRGRGQQQKRLPFQVRCDDFTVEYYPGSSRPKDYFSNLTIIDGGTEVLSQRIEVNSPLVYDDIWFYQSSYGDTGRGMKATFKVRDPRSGAEQSWQTGSTDPYAVPGMDGLRVRVLRVFPDFDIVDGEPVSRSNQPRNPAALVEAQLPDGNSRRTYLFQLRPDIKTAQDLPYDMTFLGYEGLQYTGLQVVYDPGVWVIWVGCTLMVLGIYFAFFVSHRRVWVRLREEDGETAVALAGNANKNRESFAEHFAALGDKVQAIVEANR